MSGRKRDGSRGAGSRKRGKRGSRRWVRHWPYLGIGGVAAALFATLLLVSVGGGSVGQPEASYPAGYQPPALGDPSAPVVMEMWGDFQCPFCKRFFASTLPELQRRYIDTGKLRFVWRNFAWYGPESRDAAIAAYCAGEQGKFWEYHDALYRSHGGINSGAFNRGTLDRLARELGLEMAAFTACASGVKYDGLLTTEYNSGRSKKIAGTPTFFVNGQKVVGAQPTETFAGMIENALAKGGQ